MTVRMTPSSATRHQSGVRKYLAPRTRRWNDVLDTEGNGRSHFRGCVVVLEDDSVVMGRVDGASHADRSVVSPSYNPSALPRWEGRSYREWSQGESPRPMDVQLIGSGPQGLNARCMAEDVHTFMGIRKGKAFAGWCMGRSGRRMQEDFFIHGFGTLIKFAYGSAAFFDDCIDRMNGINGTGFGIRRAYRPRLLLRLPRPRCLRCRPCPGREPEMHTDRQPARSAC